MRTDINSVFRCRICGGERTSGNYEAREMMLGLRTIFHYWQCELCGTLWLMDPPSDLGPYYRGDYYSYAHENDLSMRRLRAYLRMSRDRTYFGKGGLLGGYLGRWFGDEALLSVSRLKVGRDTRVLDVGCGSGKLLRRMVALGFQNLTGVDPFLDEDINGQLPRIRKCRLEDINGEKYDLVMFHHSLEHVADPVATLRAAAGLLATGGKCLVRLPVVAYAWEKYGTNWIQLDAPRHMWLPTEKAMRILAESVGLELVKIEYDSMGIQFWGSEFYARGVEWRLQSPWRLVREFGLNGIRRYREQATLLNRQGVGDQAAYLFGF